MEQIATSRCVHLPACILTIPSASRRFATRSRGPESVRAECLGIQYGIQSASCRLALSRLPERSLRRSYGSAVVYFLSPFVSRNHHRPALPFFLLIPLIPSSRAGRSSRFLFTRVPVFSIRLLSAPPVGVVQHLLPIVALKQPTHPHTQTVLVTCQFFF